MRIPNADWSPERLLHVYGLYHLSRLRAHPEVAALAETFEQAQKSPKAKIEALTTAGVQAMTVLAVRDDKNGELDDAVRAFFFDLLHEVVNDRNHPTFRRYLSQELTAVVNIQSDEQIRSVGILLTRLVDEENLDIKAHTDSIRKALDEFTAATKAYAEGVGAERLARWEIHEEKRRWIDAYTKSHRALQFRFYKDARRVGRFFRSPCREPAPEVPPETSEETERALVRSDETKELAEATEA